jgi:hypothetical protein
MEEHAMNSEEFAQFYGFSQGDANELYMQLEITDTVKKRKIINWYSGYNHGMGNPYSLIKYTKSYIFNNYWKGCGSIVFVEKFLWNKQIKRHFEKLSKGGSISFTLTDHFSSHHFSQLSEMVQRIDAVSGNGIGIFFSYLYWNGYITQNSIPGEYALPNYELRLEIEEELLFFTRNYTRP